MSTQQWRKTLQNVFEDIQCPPISNTETEWNTFCALLTQKWQQACPNYECNSSSRAIGSVLQAIPMNAKKPSHTSFRSRRLAKLFGRLREWQRHATPTKQESPYSFALGKNSESLACRHSNFRKHTRNRRPGRTGTCGRTQPPRYGTPSELETQNEHK